jgi:hypothetical protein
LHDRVRRQVVWHGALVADFAAPGGGQQGDGRKNGQGAYSKTSHGRIDTPVIEDKAIFACAGSELGDAAIGARRRFRFR